MVEYFMLGGARVTPYMAYQLGRLDTDLNKKFGVRLVYNSGIRYAWEQEQIFRERYVLAGAVNGRRVYDTRWWNGQLWYRISSAGTVAPPNSPIAYHQIQGSTAAVDIADTGADAGITVASSTRGRWIRQNAHKYGMDPEGDSFGEGWHFRIKNIFNAVPKPKKQEDDMIINIKGIRGKRRGGLYYVSGGVATFIGGRTEAKQGRYPMFTSETEIARLQARIKGLR